MIRIELRLTRWRETDVAQKEKMRNLKSAYPWISNPLVVQAPMRLLAGPTLSVAVSKSGGLGFLGPGITPADLEKELNTALDLVSKDSYLCSKLSKSAPVLPIGFGIQTWTGDLRITSNILRHFANRSPPAAAWLFAPRHGQAEIDSWAHEIRSCSPRTQIWIQVASVADAVAAANSPDRPDVLVVQGSDAGGHSRIQGAGLITLLPEVKDALRSCSIPLVAAGGIADARGAAAALVLGATGIAMGTRFLATPQANINPGYQRAILEGSDGGQTTVRTQLYNHLRGTMGWPPEFDARGLINASWRDHVAGVSFEENKKRHDEALKRGDEAWGAKDGRTATYAGTCVGLINHTKCASDIVKEIRVNIVRQLQFAPNLEFGDFSEYEGV